MNNDVVVRINALDNTRAAFQSLKQSLNGVQKNVQTVRSRLEALQPTFQRMALIGGAAFTGVTLGIRNATTNAVALGESVNAVNVVFGDGAADILAYGQNAAKSVGLANAEFNQMSTITGALLKDTGLSMEDVAKQTITLTERAADMASVFNTDVSDAMSAINQAIRGETEAIRRYAGDVTDATINQHLLAKGLEITTADMTEQEKRLARIEVLMAQTAVTAGDFQNTSDSLANQQRILAAQFQDMSAKLGKQLIPVFQEVLKVVQPIIERVGQWIEKNPELASKILLASAAIAGLVAVVGTLGLVIGPIIAGFSLLLSPIGLVIAAIAVLATGVYFLITRWQEFKTLVTGIWDSLPGFVQTGIKIMLGPLMAVVDTIKLIYNNWDRMVSGFKSGVNTLIGIAEFFANAYVKAINTIIGALNKIQVSIPDWVPGVGGKSFGINLPLAPEIEIPRLATGGIVTRPTIAEIGEAGPEAVIPLNRMGSMGGVHITITGNTFMSDRDMAERVGDQIIGLLKRQQQL